ncbi:hypothetical protein PoB_002571300 [Plakobranchus ocellatus]|uniref:EGF-like domain-containing protein n=1 Tax=Plakobranchus ocellatus TaxID=259542 RepID=A0AAV3ZXQ0_9GAST|nr:hypothetical protein PoB_002571300 [Plakobranchus ocellatus]
MTHDEAVVECNKLKRPLASLRTYDQMNKARQVTQWRKIHVWISAKYDKDNRAYKWEDGSYLSYHNWAHTVPQDYVCDKPHMVECSAKTKYGKAWVTYDKQESDTLKCSVHEISCKKDKELDCSTLRVRFLCPQEENQCTELQKLHAPACSGGQVCSPAPNHYHCRCPPGFMYSLFSRECIS